MTKCTKQINRLTVAAVKAFSFVAVAVILAFFVAMAVLQALECGTNNEHCGETSQQHREAE